MLRVTGLNKKEMTKTSLFHLTALNEPSSCLLQALLASKVLAARLLACIIQGAWCKPSGIHGASLLHALISVGKFRVPGRFSGRFWIDLLLGLAQ